MAALKAAAESELPVGSAPWSTTDSYATVFATAAAAESTVSEGEEDAGDAEDEVDEAAVVERDGGASGGATSYRSRRSTVTKVPSGAGAGVGGGGVGCGGRGVGG